MERKRFLAVVMTVMMVISMIPSMVFAAAPSGELGGKLKIKGLAAVGVVVSADYAKVTPEEVTDEDFTFSWSRQTGEKELTQVGTEKTYTITQDDLGCRLVLDLTPVDGSGLTGTLTAKTLEVAATEEEAKAEDTQQAETADGKINFQVLGSEELPGTDRQKEGLEDTILLPEKLEQELEESVVNNRRFLFESITGRKQMYQFSACEWIKGEYAIISWSMAEKIIRELDTESRQTDGIYLVADSTEGLKNIKSIMKELSDTGNVDIDGMIQKSETREKKMQKLLGKALFDVLFLQIVIYLTERNAEKDFFRTEGTVLLMIIMLVIVNTLKII